MIPEPVREELSNIVGPDHFLTRRDDLTKFASDATRLEFMPDAVAFPGNGQEISRILVLANREAFPVIPRGAGSGKSGGALPAKGGLVLAMDRFNRILGIDRDNFTAKVEPGVITARLQEEVEKCGLFYPPDPASIHISTIGGNVASCAGGLRAVKYGVTRDYVLGLTVVLPTGEIIRTGVETSKGVVGYDLTRLIVGSEGTLAVITAITLRLIPRPATKRTMLAFFRDAPSALESVSKILRQKVVPTTLEFMDRLSMDCVREDMAISIPAAARALLLIEVDGDGVMTDLEARKVEEICTRSGTVRFRSAAGRDEAERLWEVRRNVSESILKLGPHKISEDVVVPRSQMVAFIAFLERLGRECRLPVPAFGHAGDGNIHVNIMFDRARPGDIEKAEAAVAALFRRVIEMHGTISGEHGVGITKAPYLEMELSRPAIELMTRLKKAFDPRGILNPGKIFP
jgi:glycolate oxidase